MILEKIVVGVFQVNCYILAENRDAIIIDPGDEPEKIKETLKKFNLKPQVIINTHGHIDHIKADEAFDIPVYIHKLDLPYLKDPRLNLSTFFGDSFSLKEDMRVICVEDQQTIQIDRLKIQVIHTPGHTPGGISLLLREPRRDILFTGDTLFAGSIGRTDFLGAEPQRLIYSIKTKLFSLDERIKILPGHGPYSTLKKEKCSNLYLT